MSYAICHGQHLQALTNLVGPQQLLCHEQDREAYGGDWTQTAPRQPACVVFPRRVEEVAAVLAYCHEQRLAVVPSGGRTGLAGGAVASRGEVVLSLEKMNRILEVDPVNMSLSTEAGVTTQALQIEAARHGLFFPIDLAAKGSCQIGGNIATNAGGLKFIRFCGTREQVLGLEVVLADGRVLDLNSKVYKNNTGYDLKQLMIGSEGTLGVITKATLKLMPKPRQTALSCLGLASSSAISQLIQACHQKSLSLTACEYFSSLALSKVRKSFPHIKSPFAEDHPYYILLEVEGLSTQSSEASFMSDFLEELFHQGIIQDAVLAESSAQSHELWAMRENITESLRLQGQVRKNDIAIPITNLPAFEQQLEKIKANAHPGLEIITFGHVGDGNLHINYLGPRAWTREEFLDRTEGLEKQVYLLLQEYRGSISAEHGIGLLKKDDLTFSRSPDEIAWMRAIKKLFDPRGILNPGKIFDPLPPDL